jgi:multidrug efflux pump
VISRFFIDRPIFASVVSAFIVIAGLAAIRALPVAAYPDILPPEIEVSAFYAGVNSATVAETVYVQSRAGGERPAAPRRPYSWSAC